MQRDAPRGFKRELYELAMFAVVRGSVLVSLASTLGATCAFLLGRSLARDWVARRIEGNG